MSWRDSVSEGRGVQYAIAGVLFAATLLAYSGVAHHEFLDLDDLHDVVLNPDLTRDATPFSLLRHFWTPHRANWLPIYWISLHLGHALHGANASAFLLTNVVLHAIGSIVLFAAFARMTGAIWCSAFVAGVFALHPLHVESVAWVTERKDVLAGLFWMLGLYSYAAYVEKPRASRRQLAVMVCLLLGLLSKALCVTFPFVLLLLDYWPLARLQGAWRARVVEKIPLFALAVLTSAVAYWTQQRFGNMGIDPFGLDGRIANALQSYWLYLGDAFWPTGLAAVYPHPFALRAVGSQDEQMALGLALALLGTSGLSLVAAARRPQFVVGWFWYLGTLVPMIGIIPLGVMARADRYMYVPLVGLAIIAAWGARELAGSSRARGRVAVGLGVAVLAALGVATSFQVAHWSDSVALYERAIAVTERNRFAHENLARVLADEGRNEQAAGHFEEALRIEPQRARSHFGLAVVSERLGRRDAAIRSYREGIALRPRKVRAHGSLGMLLVEAGRFEQAEEHLAYAVRVLPNEASYQHAMGEVMSAQGRSADALDRYKRALDADPDRVAARLAAIRILASSEDASLRDPRQAVELARAGLARSAEDPELLEGLSLALTAAGRGLDAKPMEE